VVIGTPAKKTDRKGKGSCVQGKGALSWDKHLQLTILQKKQNLPKWENLAAISRAPCPSTAPSFGSTALPIHGVMTDFKANVT